MLRDPTGLDGSIPPKDRDAAVRAVRSWVRRVQPGIAFWADLLDHIRMKRKAKHWPADYDPDSRPAKPNAHTADDPEL